MDLSLAFLTGFLSSLHCAGMCGPLVLAYSSQSGNRNPFSPRMLLSHLFYNGGRILSYGFVGAVMGFIGGSVGTLRGVGFWFSGIAGLATIGFGMFVLRGAPLLPLGETRDRGDGKKSIVGTFLGLYRASFGGLIARNTFESKFYVGLLTPLLPCGLLYGMLMRSAGTESAMEGGLIMVAFGLGIVPSLIAAGILGSFLGSTTRRWADRVAAITLMIMGASLVWRAVMAGLGSGGHGM